MATDVIGWRLSFRRRTSTLSEKFHKRFHYFQKVFRNTVESVAGYRHRRTIKVTTGILRVGTVLGRLEHIV